MTVNTLIRLNPINVNDLPIGEESARDSLKSFLDKVAAKYERKQFIDSDPVCIPHAFESARDKEVIGLFAAILAWGRRDVLIRKLENLCDRMNYTPYQFVREFNPARDGYKLDGFGHRTFLTEDAVQLIVRLKSLLESHGTIESVCRDALKTRDEHIGPGIEALSNTLLMNPELAPVRLRKHLARPSTGSACKRLSMYFRWMVRPGPVDLGIWKSIGKNQLILPLDVHSGRQGRAVGLIQRKGNDWKTALELTNACKLLDSDDPCKYDFALFGTGAAGETLFFPS